MEELQSIWRERGKEFIEELLTSYVIVTEKLSGSSFAVELIGDELSLFKGTSQKKISLVDRTLMMYYEPAIKHMQETGASLKAGWRYCFQYFVHNEPGVIKYSKLPKNNLVLTHIQVKNDSGKTVKIIDDPRVLKEWASKLDVMSAQPVFSGHLTADQKEKIKEFISMPVEDSEELFGTSSFAEYLLGVLNPNLNSTLLHTDLSNPIDSLIFKFIKAGTGKTISTRLIDPYTRTLMKEREQFDIRKAPADMNEIVLLDLLAFLEERGIKEGDALADNPDERYIEIISTLFKEYVSRNEESLSGVSFDSASFSAHPEFNLNLEFIKDTTVKEHLKTPHLADLYRIMLGSLRKKRNPDKAGPVMTAAVIEDFNRVVDNITKLANEQAMKEFKTFKEYLSLKESSYEAIDEPHFERVLSFKEFTGLNRIKITEALSVPHKSQGKKLVNIIVGRFQPFTLGHAKVFKQLHDQNGLPVVVFTVRGKKPDPEKSPFSEELQQAMFAKMQREYRFLEAMYVVPSAAIDTLFSTLRPAYEPVLWGFGTDRKKQYEYMITKPDYREQLGVVKEFGGYEIKRADEDVSASKVREAIKLDDKRTFERMTPRSIHDMWEVLQDVLAPIAESTNIDAALIKLYEDLVSVSIGTQEVGQILSTDTETVQDITRIVRSSGVKDKLDEFLTGLGVPRGHIKQITGLLATGDLSKVMAYTENRTMKISDFIGRKVNALEVNERLFGIGNKRDSLSLFSYQWPTSPIMGKGEFWLSFVIDGGSSAGTGDVSINGQTLEVKGIGARLVGQRGYGNAKQMVSSFKAALEDIAREVGATGYAVIDGKNTDWNITKRDARLLQRNLESIVELAGRFNQKQISYISRRLVEAYKTLYVNLNPARHGKVLEAAISPAGAVNADVFNRAMLKVSFDYYLGVEHFKYFCVLNNKTGNVLIIDPADFGRFVDNGTILYTPPSWGEAAGVQGGYYAIAIDRMN